ncbi:MAG TPA: hypothetical protein VFG47_16135, partial [Geminicoccaceae bacterium]|nr:hypothetical protein [Geminicoccaceae bacterium]
APAGGERDERGGQPVPRRALRRLVPERNRRFAVAAAEPGSAFVPVAGALADEVLCEAERITAWPPATIRAFGADHFPRPPLRRVA